MIENYEIKFNEANTIQWCCQRGLPNADGTFDLYDQENTQVVTAAVATWENDNWAVTTGSGKSQANPKKLTMTDTVDIEVEKLYLLREAGLPDRWVEVMEISANAYAILNVDCEFDYSTAAKLYTIWFSAPVPSTAVDATSNIADNWRGTWTYVLADDSATYVDREMYDVVRFKTNTPPLTVADVIKRFDNIGAYLRPQKINLDTKLQIAWDDVKQMMRDDGIDPRLVANPDQFDAVLYHVLRYNLIDNGVVPDTWLDNVEGYRRSVISDKNWAFKMAKLSKWYDTNNDGEVASGEENVRKVYIPQRY